jgi:Pyridoxamine 5'-phosphate oxidase
VRSGMKVVVKLERVAGRLPSLGDEPFPVAEFLARPLVARLSTGRNVVRPVWFLWEDEAFWVLIGDWSRLGARLDADPLFELVVDTCDLGTGTVRQVVARGRGAVVDFDTARGRRKLVRYLGEDEDRWDSRFSLHGDPNARGIRWARLVPDTLLVTDLSFQPAQEEVSP